MKPIKTFKIGSSYFFGCFDDYIVKDLDEINIMDEFLVKPNSLVLRKGDRDVFFYRNMDKEGFIEDTLSSCVPVRAGKFLVREFADYIGFTIEDLKKLKEVFDRIDDKHTYEKVIYDAYMENNGFYLTEGQLDSAYAEYKRKRPEKYA